MKNQGVHRQPMGNSAYVGTPDFYYEGNKSHIWVEWKFWKTVPPAFNLVTPTRPSHKTKLSSMQTAWLDRAWRNGTDAIVICGCPDGGAILTIDECHYTWQRATFMEMCKTRKELAAWLENYVWSKHYERVEEKSRFLLTP